jgi:hypothetical protein
MFFDSNFDARPVMVDVKKLKSIAAAYALKNPFLV